MHHLSLLFDSNRASSAKTVAFRCCVNSITLCQLSLALRERDGVRELSTKMRGFPHPYPPPQGEGELRKVD
jgi:hypothetical protein